MTLIPWTELNRGGLEARFWCKTCGKSNFVTANKNPFYFAANDKDVSLPCATCGALAIIKKTPMGLQVR